MVERKELRALSRYKGQPSGFQACSHEYSPTIPVITFKYFLLKGFFSLDPNEMFHLRFLAVLALCAVGSLAFTDDSYMHPQTSANARADKPDPEPSEHWRILAQESLAEKLKQKEIVGRAKNVIMFLGDGWGMPTITAARILKGQERDNVTFGEEGQLHVDTFPFTGTSRTFCADAQVADSACSATAYLCGVKANSGTAGVSVDVKRHDCLAQQNEANHVSSILAWAQAAGKATGVVTTTRITHASPSGTYAHIGNRDWESDADVKSKEQDPDTCSDIAEQLILNEPGKNIDVIMGGGRVKFLPENVLDSENEAGQRQDGKNLPEIWKSQKTDDGKNDVNATYIESGKALKDVDPEKTDSLLGLFASDHIAYFHEQEQDDDPTLTDMTEKAIQILSKNPNGFFLFVEGGRIDLAHHDNQALRSLWEAVEFDKAIKKGDDMTDDNETLIVVTADHSHAFIFAGYAYRGSPLTGQAGIGDDDLPYNTLNYANGPGWKNFTDEKRHNISSDGEQVHNTTYQQTPLVPLKSETHGGEDVMIFAKGPFAHLLTGAQLQSYIPHAMAYASCVGDGLTYCGPDKSGGEGDSSSAASNLANILIVSATLSILKLGHKIVT